MGILDFIGKTPLVPLEMYSSCEIYAKLEYLNPTGSVKDRTALYMIKDAIKRKVLESKGHIVDATSGNAGISLAFIASRLRYKCTICMPENMSVERQTMIKAYGAEVILTNAKDGMAGAIEEVNKILKKDKKAICLKQFSNPANKLAHFETTGPEIYASCPDADYIVSPVGTGGTYMGIKEYFEKQNSKTKICAVEPLESPLLTKGYAGEHKIQGIGANFIPDILDVAKIDKVVCVSSERAYKRTKELSTMHGMFVGITSGAALDAAYQLIDKERRLKKVVIMIPDSGDRYLSEQIY